MNAIDEAVDFMYDIIKKEKVSEIHIISPCSDKWLSNPTSHILIQESHLGIPKNMLKDIYQAIYAKMREGHTSRTKELSKWTFILLLANSNDTFYWNKRKVACCDSLWSRVEEDVISSILLRLHPKCAAIYEHRRWLLKQPKFMTEEILSKELRLCLMTASRYINNYYAWSHRQWCLAFVHDFQAYKDDLDSIRKWRERNISQYCSFSHCQFLLNRMRAKLEDLMYEYNDIVQLIDIYPNHLSLWYHRRWVVHQLSLTNTESCQSIVQQEISLEGDSYYIDKHRRSLELLLNG